MEQVRSVSGQLKALRSRSPRIASIPSGFSPSCRASGERNVKRPKRRARARTPPCVRGMHRCRICAKFTGVLANRRRRRVGNPSASRRNITGRENRPNGGVSLTLHRATVRFSSSTVFPFSRGETAEQRQRRNLRACGSCESKGQNGRTDERHARARACRSTVRRTYRFLNLTYSCIKSFWDLTSLHGLFSPTPSRSHERLERTYVPGGLVRVRLPIALSFSRSLVSPVSLYLSLSLCPFLYHSFSFGSPCRRTRAGSRGRSAR